MVSSVTLRRRNLQLNEEKATKKLLDRVFGEFKDVR